MDDEDRQSALVQSALMQALTTEHFVLQTAASGTLAEAGARASLFLAYQRWCFARVDLGADVTPSAGSGSPASRSR